MVLLTNILFAALAAVALPFASAQAVGCADITQAQLGIVPSTTGTQLVVTNNAALTGNGIMGLNIKIVSTADGTPFNQFALQASQGMLKPVTANAAIAMCPNNPAAFAAQSTTAMTNVKFTWQGAYPVTFNALLLSSTNSGTTMLISCASATKINDPACMTNLAVQAVAGTAAGTAAGTGTAAAGTGAAAAPPPAAPPAIMMGLMGLSMNALFGLAAGVLCVVMVGVVFVSMLF